MPEYIEIYGSRIPLTDLPPEEEIVNSGLPRKEQKWVKNELPAFFSKVEYDKNGDLLLTKEQEQYASQEVHRCKNGVHIYINGKARYLTRKYYFYLQYYILEDGNAPEFREADRLYFIFLEYWQRVEWSLGMIRAKKRRAGASSQACSNLIYEAIFYKNSNCGLISKTNEDSKATFTEMVTASYRQLPAFLKPKQINREDSVTELVFAQKAEAVKQGVKAAVKTDEGHSSKINYRAPVLNAYDRGRMSLVLVDEGAKFPAQTPTAQLLAIISKTLVKGVKRVGWVDMPSTVNEMTKHGGAEFFKVWKNANQFKRKPTINRLVRFFQPAFDAYEGFIDEFGDSVTEAPTEEQYEYLVSKWVKHDEDTGELISELSEEDIRLGSKQYVKVKRREGLEGIDLEEEIRMNPCDEDEAFLSAVSDCAFNSVKIKMRQKELEENPVIMRSILLYRKEDQTVTWRDANENEKSFCWRVTSFPKAGTENKFILEGGTKMPANSHIGAITVDSYSNSQGGRKYGSKASAWIGYRFDATNPHNTGRPIAHLYGRPLEKDTLHQQIMLAAEFWGFLVWYEHTADDYDSYFRERGKRGYLGKYPLSLIDPVKRNKDSTERHRGTPITPFSLTKQLDNGIAYFEHHCDMIDFPELLENSLIFDPYDRTSYDTVVSFLMLVSVLMEPSKRPQPMKFPLVQVFK
jgi:hypothetical protein